MIKIKNKIKDRESREKLEIVLVALIVFGPFFILSIIFDYMGLERIAFLDALGGVVASIVLSILTVGVLVLLIGGINEFFRILGQFASFLIALFLLYLFFTDTAEGSTYDRILCFSIGIHIWILLYVGDDLIDEDGE